MRFPLALLTLFVVAPALSGCGGFGLFGGADLTTLQVAGRYEFTEFTLDPVSDAVRDRRLLGDALSEDITLLLLENGEVRLERIRGDRVDETVASGRFRISGRTVTVRFSNARDVDAFYMPAEIAFEGGGGRLSAEVFREGINLERISSDYRGITRADVVLRIALREID
jgi:hypothetical protein